MQKCIEINDISVFRNDTEVFKGLSLEIDFGCNTAIIGPNGSGKTTLLKLISRDIYPVEIKGSYLKLFGRDKWNVFELRSEMGIISSDLPKNFNTQTTGLNVILSGCVSGLFIDSVSFIKEDLKKKATDIMDSLSVLNLSRRPFASMSTGQQSRFLLGRALINNPHTLLLDEPTTGLDLKACFKYLEIIRNLIRNNKTVILVTHHIHEIPPEITRVIFLKDGKITGDGLKKEMLTDKKLSKLYDISVSVLEENEYYLAIPRK